MLGHQVRATSIVAVLLLAMPGAPAWAQGGTTATQTVDVMNQLWGRHPGVRANHAKGVVVEGSFTPTPEAATLSKASLFSGGPVSVTVRFSDSTGLPSLPDGSEDANPHGMSMKFDLPGGGEMDVVTNSLAFFPVATGEEFRDLLQALAASGPDAAKPTKAEQFIAAHPSVPKAFASAATPTSFARAKPTTASTRSSSSTRPASGSRSASNSSQPPGRSIWPRPMPQSSRLISSLTSCRNAWPRSRSPSA